MALLLLELYARCFISTRAEFRGWMGNLFYEAKDEVRQERFVMRGVGLWFQHMYK